MLASSKMEKFKKKMIMQAHRLLHHILFCSVFLEKKKKIYCTLVVLFHFQEVNEETETKKEVK